MRERERELACLAPLYGSMRYSPSRNGRSIYLGNLMTVDRSLRKGPVDDRLAILEQWYCDPIGLLL